MKKIILYSILVLCLVIIISKETQAQWQPDIRLTNNTSVSQTADNNVWCIASSGPPQANVHVVWFDNRDGNNEIYYKRSPDGGISWGADTRLTSDSSNSYNPSVSVSGQDVHVVWVDNRDGNFEIYYKRSTDGGLSWGVDTRQTNNSASSFTPSISVIGSFVHVVWTDDRDGNKEIYYKYNPTGSVGIINISLEIPSEFSLSQNYPNPFNPITKIRFEIPKSGFVKLIVFDALGREIETLANEKLNVGSYEVDWDGSAYPTGIYFYKIVTDEFSDVKKMILIK